MGNNGLNILYISKLSGNLFAGPNNSVPAQIKSQSKIDNVFWYNLNYIKREEWKAIGCYNFNDYPSGRLVDLPSPFNKPDIVVVEEFYCFPFEKTLQDVRKSQIPFVIIPRSELTEQAQSKKKIKKKIGNMLYFNSLARNASAIQYLSEQEKKESEKQWKTKSFIIPNGTDVMVDYEKKFSHDRMHAVYIGRYEMYQKGLDILVEAVTKRQDLLRQNNFKITMYGVDQEGTVSQLMEDIKKLGIEDLFEINECVFGEEKRKVLLSADLFIMTSRFEGMPMGLIEALAYGLPVLVTRGTNMLDEIKGSKAGWIAENDANSVAHAFEMMIRDKCQMQKISLSSKALARNYSWEHLAIISHKMYNEINSMNGDMQ